MTASAKVKPFVISKPPLLEAVFEMRWELSPVPNAQIRRDPAYPLLYGRLYDRFKKDYTVVEDLPSVQVHPDGSPYTVRHRMRKAAGEYPLVQIGPGILTVNLGKDYSWDRFREEIVRIFEGFTDFYPASTFPLNILKTEIRYINGIEFAEGEDVLQFFSEKLHTKIELDPDMFSKINIDPKAQGVGLNMGFQINQPVGAVMLSLGSGQMEDKPAIIQQTLIQSIGENSPQELGSLDPWLDAMHNIARHWFETLYKGELMKRFI